MVRRITVVRCTLFTHSFLNSLSLNNTHSVSSQSNKRNSFHRHAAQNCIKHVRSSSAQLRSKTKVKEAMCTDISSNSLSTVSSTDNSLSRVLFIFRSSYLFAIGVHSIYLALPGTQLAVPVSVLKYCTRCS